ncbi:MAG: hypothetical protein RLZZ262_2396, partial [Bacteroidota bacterium]
MSTLTYTKGLHVIVDLEQCQINCDQMESFRTMIMQEIAICDLHVLGSVFHAFDNGAFTA